MTGREGEMERGRERERERERERDCLFCKFVYYSHDFFFSTAGGYFDAVCGRLSPDKLLLNN